MKLLYLTNGYPPRHAAGAEVYTAGLASAFARAGHSVRVVCVGEWESGPQPLNGAEDSDQEGVRVTRLNLNWRQGPDPNRYLYDNPAVEAYLAALLAEDRPDLVHVTSCYTLSASVLRTIERSGLPLVITLTDFWFLCPRITLLRSDGVLCDGQTTPWECLKCVLHEAKAYRWPTRVLPEAAVQTALTWISTQPVLSRRPGLRGMALDMGARKRLLPTLLDLADVIIAPSHALARLYHDNGLNRPLRVMAYGHRLDWVKDVQPRPAAARLAFGFVGRITEAKGVHVLTAAAARLGADLPLQIDVWGDTHQEPAYFAALPKPGPKHPPMTFHGRFERGCQAEVFSQIDVLVVPSIWYENNPLVIQEAFAAGIPVIASDLGGMAEFVEPEVNGLLFETGNADALAAAMQRLATQPELLERLRRGVPRVQSVEQALAELETLYREVLAGAPREDPR